ncbi:hypothetical protein EGW08_003910 [Elysia chlorotica]|uniref:Sialin n=1 Tax=Elysia chlorotica TaxID=188477 RepID=A0A433U3D2_ELYCH|nr:hypothetical protein EGW08_003910 [Elysia chlorotica]
MLPHRGRAGIPGLLSQPVGRSHYTDTDPTTGLCPFRPTGIGGICLCKPKREKSQLVRESFTQRPSVYVVEVEMKMQNQFDFTNRFSWSGTKGRNSSMPHDRELSEVSHLLEKDDEAAGPCSSAYIPARWVLALWSFLGFINLFTLRTDINIAILAMVNSTNSSSGPTALGDQGRPAQPAQFSWSETEQSVILSAFFYGYCSSQILGGYLSTAFGAKLVMGYSLLATSVLALLTPVATVHGYYLLVACRVGQGLGQGLAQPCMHTMWSNWAPDSEKSKLLAITFSGCQLGTVLVSWSAGIVCEQALLGGWPFVFYLYGGLGVVWSVGWLLVVHETPSSHPRISQTERKFIEDSAGRETHNEKSSQAPLGRIVRSPAFIAIIFAHFANDWGSFALTTCLPSFLQHILKYDLQENGVLSALPFLILMVTNPLSGYMADRLRTREILSTKNTRKLLNSIGLFIPSALMLAVCLCDTDRDLIVTLLTLAVGFSGFTMAGYSVNHLDIAPSHAGILYAITNTIGTTSGFIGPAIVGVLTDGRNTIYQWNIFFYLSAAIFFVGGLVFALFAEGEPQDWGGATQTHPEAGETNSSNGRKNSESHHTPAHPTIDAIRGNIQSSPSQFVYDDPESLEDRSEPSSAGAGNESHS